VNHEDALLIVKTIQQVATDLERIIFFVGLCTIAAIAITGRKTRNALAAIEKSKQ
jgi:hypothetical protein